MRMVTLGIALAVILATARAVLPGANGKPLIAPTIRFDGRERAAGGAPDILRFSVVNPNRTPVFVHGFPPHPDPDKQSILMSPHLQVEVRRAGKWISAPIGGGCLTGVGPVPLAPGARRFFSVEGLSGKWDRVRAGLAWSAAPIDLAKTEFAWSLPITRHELASSPSGIQAE